MARLSNCQSLLQRALPPRQPLPLRSRQPLQASLRHADSEQISALHAALAQAAEATAAAGEAHVQLSAAGVATAEARAVAASAEREAEAQAEEAAKWRARAAAAEALRLAAVKRGEEREAELLGGLAASDGAARGAIADGVMRRQECALLADEIAMQESDALLPATHRLLDHSLLLLATHYDSFLFAT